MTLFVFTLACSKKGAAYLLRYGYLMPKDFFNGIVSMYNIKLFTTKTVRELLFDGYKDPLLSFKIVAFDKFAYFYQVNPQSIAVLAEY